MKLKSARIKNFKRFKDITIEGLPSSAKLIVLLGPNGCGKSSMFDAFQSFLKTRRFYGLSDEMKRYYRRVTSEAMDEEEEVHLELHNGNPTTTDEFKKSLYIRSAYRHDPSFRQTTFEQQPNVLDRHEVQRMIDTDQTVQNNYQRIIWRLLGKVTTLGLSTDDIMMEVIGDLQKSMKNVFGDIHLDALVSAQETGTFTFTKGKSKNFLYENLSAGEKAAFDLLLDIVVNKPAFYDSLYCIDEPEAHLSTRLQGALLRELFDLVPLKSQLWLATHSIGMVRVAQEIRAEFPEQVVFLDMGYEIDGSQRNYDEPQVLQPSEPDHLFWTRHYTVALDDMAGLLAPDRIVFCEGSKEDNKSAFDESCYNKIFALEFPQTHFISVGPTTKVEKRMGDLLPILHKIIDGTLILRFRDRDDLTPEEVQEKCDAGVRVMSNFRNIESMLLSDDVLKILCEKHDKLDCFDTIRIARDNALKNATGIHASDDFKPAAQTVHQVAKDQLQLLRPGESKEAFMRDVLAPLVTKDTTVYQNLRTDIFGE